MQSNEIFKTGQQWDDGNADNQYWIALNPFMSRTQHGDGMVVGREVKSIPELERLAEDIRSSLDRAVATIKAKLEAKKRLGSA